MLTELLIRSFAVIDELRMPLGPGMAVVTGETGAGKSLLVDALGLALGERAEGGLIRAGAENAEIVATFEIPPTAAAHAWLLHHDLAAPHGECIIRRLIGQDRSRAFINATPVPLQRLHELGELLVDLHGQHEHQRLMRPDTQRTLLDAYAQATAEHEALTATIDALHAALARQKALKEAAERRSARASLLRYQIEELEKLQPKEGEWADLNATEKRLAHAQELSSGITDLINGLAEGDRPLSGLIEGALGQVRALMRHEPRLVEIEDLLKSASVEIAEAALALNRMASNMDNAPVDLEALEARVSRWHEIARKHRINPDDLPDFWARLAAEHEALQSDEEAIGALSQEIAEYEAAALRHAAALTAKREHAAPRLSAAVSEEMHRLGLGASRFSVGLEKEELGAHGCERVEFLVSPGADSPFRPLSRVASGGELSRISLALQVVLADIDGGPTLVFDEVDVGIGGAVAEIVGQRLHELARTRQVLCITHLPQVAAQGDTHLLVEKGLSDGQLMSSVEVLNPNRRIEEIARMLGGVAINARTRALARDMLGG